MRYENTSANEAINSTKNRFQLSPFVEHDKAGHRVGTGGIIILDSSPM